MDYIKKYLKYKKKYYEINKHIMRGGGEGDKTQKNYFQEILETNYKELWDRIKEYNEKKYFSTDKENKEGAIKYETLCSEIVQIISTNKGGSIEDKIYFLLGHITDNLGLGKPSNGIEILYDKIINILLEILTTPEEFKRIYDLVMKIIDEIPGVGYRRQDKILKNLSRKIPEKLISTILSSLSLSDNLTESQIPDKLTESQIAAILHACSQNSCIDNSYFRNNHKAIPIILEILNNSTPINAEMRENIISLNSLNIVASHRNAVTPIPVNNEYHHDGRHGR